MGDLDLLSIRWHALRADIDPQGITFVYCIPKYVGMKVSRVEHTTVK